MPPPKHVHPGRLVVSKPDLPQQPRSSSDFDGRPRSCTHRLPSAGLDSDCCRYESFAGSCEPCAWNAKLHPITVLTETCWGTLLHAGGHCLDRGGWNGAKPCNTALSLRTRGTSWGVQGV